MECSLQLKGVSSATDIIRGTIRDQDEIDQHHGIIRDDTSQEQDAADEIVP